MLKTEAGLPRARWLLAPPASHVYHALILSTTEKWESIHCGRVTTRAVRAFVEQQKKKKRENQNGCLAVCVKPATLICALHFVVATDKKKGTTKVL